MTGSVHESGRERAARQRWRDAHQALVALGYLDTPDDDAAEGNLSGPAMQHALGHFQEENGLVISEGLDSETFEVLMTMYEQTQEIRSHDDASAHGLPDKAG